MSTNILIKKLKETNKHECANSSIRAQTGFGLLEVLISVGILALVTGAVIGLGNISVKNSVISADRTIAYNLAQEGQEGLKQIRDSKWVDNSSNITDPWNRDFKTAGGPYYIGKYPSTPDENGDPNAGKFYLDTNSNLGNKEIDGTTYTRSITFSRPDDEEALDKTFIENGIDNTTEPNKWMIKAIVNVTWSEYGRDWTVELPVYFTDWMPY